MLNDHCHRVSTHLQSINIIIIIIIKCTYFGLHVKYTLFCEILMKLEFSGQFFSKNTQI